MSTTNRPSFGQLLIQTVKNIGRPKYRAFAYVEIEFDYTDTSPSDAKHGLDKGLQWILQENPWFAAKTDEPDCAIHWRTAEGKWEIDTNRPIHNGQMHAFQNFVDNFADKVRKAKISQQVQIKNVKASAVFTQI